MLVYGISACCNVYARRQQLLCQFCSFGSAKNSIETHNIRTTPLDSTSLDKKIQTESIPQRVNLKTVTASTKEISELRRGRRKEHEHETRVVISLRSLSSFDGRVPSSLSLSVSQFSRKKRLSADRFVMLSSELRSVMSLD